MPEREYGTLPVHVEAEQARMTCCGMMRTAASRTGMETHGSAWLVIDCYPLAQLNTTFYLYDIG